MNELQTEIESVVNRLINREKQLEDHSKAYRVDLNTSQAMVCDTKRAELRMVRQDLQRILMNTGTGQTTGLTTTGS